jgi:hypothetical protein
MLSAIFERFAQASPVTVMVRSVMERIFNPEILDSLFEETAQHQYTRELLFSTVVNLMSLVVCSIRPSVSAAYKAYQKEPHPIYPLRRLMLNRWLIYIFSAGLWRDCFR